MSVWGWGWHTKYCFVNLKAVKDKIESKFVCKTNAWLDFVFICSRFLLCLHMCISPHCLAYNYFFSSVFKKKNDTCTLKIRHISHMKKRKKGKSESQQEIGSYSDSHRSRNSLFPVFLKRRGMKAMKTLTITSTYPLQRQYKLNIDREANIILFKMQFQQMDFKKNKYIF